MRRMNLNHNLIANSCLNNHFGLCFLRPSADENIEAPKLYFFFNHRRFYSTSSLNDLPVPILAINNIHNK